MTSMEIRPAAAIRGSMSIPGDKSISHRAVMFGALAEGTTRITNFLESADCRSTLAVFRAMGIDAEDGIQPDGSGNLLIHGKGLHGLRAPECTLDCGNSGTTIRLMSGILAGQTFAVRLTGDASIQKRPMGRVIRPLSLMGADIRGEKEAGLAPLLIQGRPLHGIHYDSPVASAQVKSAILLAGLYADGDTSVTEPALSRDHTERMLAGFGADCRSEGTTAHLVPGHVLSALDVHVPGDISSAAYFLAAACLLPNSEFRTECVGTNPTRDGFLRAAAAMGAAIARDGECTFSGEPTADLTAKSSALHGTVIGGALIPALIDELPILAVMAACADGETIIRDAAELKVKESNRIDLMVQNLSAMGADIAATDDGMIIHGGRPLHGAAIDPAGDHRIAMAMTVAALAADSPSILLDRECVAISFPDFFERLNRFATNNNGVTE